MKFTKGKWYKTTDGFDVEFIVPIEKDGMYNVFRHDEDHGFLPFYTNEEGKTAYGEAIILSENRENSHGAKRS
jgi:hypothetical protein